MDKNPLEFQEKFKQLVETHNVSASMDIGCYGEHEGIELCAGQFKVAYWNSNLQRWEFNN